MSKLLLLLFLGLAAYLVFKALRRRDGNDRRADRADPRAPERMVACAHCGVHLPESEAIADDGRHYCCAAHRQDAR